MNPVLWMLLLGFLPYQVNYRHGRGKLYELTMTALFWRFCVSRRRQGVTRWQVEVMLLQRLKGMIWQALEALLKR